MRLHDTLTGDKKDVVPLDGQTVRMYVCGITPYSESHVGHALKAVVFDVLRRYLEWSGYKVRHVENVTDIDDKLIERANAEGITIADLARRHTDRYLADLHRLNVLPATDYPYATDEMPSIIRTIEGLIANGFAYESGGDVYYRVRKKTDYGKLSHRNIDDLLSGARIDPSELKEDPLDFALWKTAKPGEPSWESPWGHGRPGWHIECSAMSASVLGEQIDIHGGGADLIFPHHENEIAQSEAYTGKTPFANIWVHNALLQLGGEKMSKSIGNLVSFSEAIDLQGADALRMLIISGHYRSPLTFTEEALKAARTGADRLRDAASAAPPPSTAGKPATGESVRARFVEAMDDDLGTPAAVALLFELSRDINRARDTGHDMSDAQATLRELAGVLGFTLAAPETGSQEAAPFIELLIELRRELRAAKQFQLADLVRDGLTTRGVELRDSPEGTTWHLV
ncbi:MAG: cysteine--tRNA ligase [Tepidiformaceae bacterium]